MNKSDLVSAIADNSGLSKADAARALEATTSAITGALSKGDSVAITGFGSFLVNDKGVILYKHIGEIDQNVWDEKFAIHLKSIES